MSKPRLLDAFCGAGGCTRGYQLAGFHVTGVDIKPQPRYVGDDFHQDNALDFIRAHGHEFDAIHASPPCQQYTTLRARQDWREYPDLVGLTRDTLFEIGLPYVIENVPGAPLNYYITLCGGMFGLRTYRHRRFECSFFMMQPPHPPHVVKTSTKKRRSCWDAGMHVSVTGDVSVYVGSRAMGINWMTGNELSQAIPPAYTEYVGRQLLAHILGVRAEAA